MKKALLLLLAILASGCDEAARADGISHLDDLPLLTASEELRMGDRDDPEAGFSRVNGIQVDRDGRLYVFEGTESRIRVYSPDGALLHRIGGGRGEGPGEFQGSTRFGMAGDTVWAIDNGLLRITLFDREGRLLSTGRFERLPIPLPNTFGFIIPWTMGPDGGFVGYFAMIGTAPELPRTEVSPTDPIPWPFVVFDASGQITDTIGWADRPPPRLWRPPSEAGPGMRFADVEGARRMVPSPPSRLPWTLPHEDGLVTVTAVPPEDAAEAVIRATRVGHEGDTLYDLHLRYDPAPWSPAELDSIAAREARGESSGPVGQAPSAPPANWQAIARALRAEMDFPRYQVPVLYPWLANDGTLWIRMRVDDPEVGRWVLVEPDGGLRGVVSLPSGVRPMWSHGDTLWAVEPDEVDVPWVVRFRIGTS
jgi:hypothetical protein